MTDNVDTEAVGYITACLTYATDGKKEITVEGVYLLCAAESDYAPGRRWSSMAGC